MADVGGCEDEPAALLFGAELDVAATFPKEDTVADFIVLAVMGAEASLIEPNVTVFAAGALSVPPRVITSAAAQTWVHSVRRAP